MIIGSIPLKNDQVERKEDWTKLGFKKQTQGS